jgi:hypothetical protein
VYVHRRNARRAQHPLGKYLTIGRDDDEVGLETLNDAAVIFTAEPDRLVHGDSALLRLDFDRPGLHPVPSPRRLVRLRENCANIVRRLQQYPERRNCEKRGSEKNDTHCLPFAGFGQFFDLISDKSAFQTTEVIHKEHAVQMVNLVTQAPRHQPFGLDSDLLPFGALASYYHSLRPRDRFAEIRHAQTAFVIFLRSLSEDDFRIAQNDEFARPFPYRKIYRGESNIDSDLRSSQSDSRSRIHGLDHVPDYFLKFFVEGHDVAADCP